VRSVFVGTVEISWHCLRAILAVDRVDAIYTMPLERAERISAFSDFEDLGVQYGIPVFREPNINDPRVVEQIRAFEPEAIYVIGWPRLVKEPLLSMPPKGCIGIHSSLLPKYRGGAPVNWGLIHGEREWGITLMYLGAGADNGDIIWQESFPVGPDETCADVYAKATEASVRALRRMVPLLAEGRAPRVAQQDAEASAFPKRKPEDGWIDWTRSARQIHDWVRALTHPYPGAFTEYGGRRLTVWRASVLEEGGTGTAGTVVGVVPYEGVAIQCGEGVLLLRSVQPEGDREMPATVWQLHQGVAVGSRLGGAPA